VSGLLALPKPPTTKGEGRVHRIRDDEEGEAIMPKGHYERKPKDAAPIPANDPAPPPQKRAYRKKAAIVAVRPKANGAHAVAAFGASLDLRSGAVTINAASGSLSLAPDEVLALLGFLRR
jgi:hypothetical protein